MTDPPVQQLGGAVTIQGAPLLASVYRCVLAGIARRRHDGLPCADLLEVARALRRAHVAHERQEVARDVDTSSCWGDQQSRDDWRTTGEAAALLGCSRRSVQRMARAPGGLDAIRVGRTYLLRSAPLLVLAEERRRDDKRPK